MLNTHRFGVEIETIGRTRDVVARAIAAVVGGHVEYRGRQERLDPWVVIDGRGRVWRAVSDGSLSMHHAHAEIVTPILTYDDVSLLQDVVRAVARCGARVDSSTAIHIHIDGAPFDARTVRNLVKMFAKQEALIFHALGVSASRRARYCREIDPAFLRQLETRRPRSMEDVNRLWYGQLNRCPQHYDQSRYHALNIHSLFTRGTIEFRLFEGTLHAGVVKSYVQFVLAIARLALTSRAASSRRRPFDPVSAKYDFRCFLLRLGMIGDEFKTARLHLTRRLTGSAAWKHGRPARPAPAAVPATASAPTAAPTEPAPSDEPELVAAAE